MLRYQLEEYEPAKPFWGWIIVIVLSVLTLSWGMITHMAVPDVERHWDFGSVPDAPGESAFSTVPPPRAPEVPLQIELLPGREVSEPVQGDDPNARGR
jgi:hypothetical protein